ncbi:hypothetical protein [Citrobacter freundii]|uniref:hypothetical protein n=1 Tax=Citrobacter freundii TaxID=546 RepID=UPI001BD09DA2|nr:hypothetical protein [Citrobacter freundii]
MHEPLRQCSPLQRRDEIAEGPLRRAFYYRAVEVTLIFYRSPKRDNLPELCQKKEIAACTVINAA